jgi:hypothetical protein
LFVKLRENFELTEDFVKKLNLKLEQTVLRAMFHLLLKIAQIFQELKVAKLLKLQFEKY